MDNGPLYLWLVVWFTGNKSNEEVCLWFSYNHQYQSVASRALGVGPQDTQQYVFLWRLVHY